MVKVADVVKIVVEVNFVKIKFVEVVKTMDVVKAMEKDMEFRLQLLNKVREVLVNVVVQDW